MKNIIICAAKTGGHIFPALGFAKEALKNDYKITFLGTNTDLEKKIFQQNENIDFIKFENNLIKEFKVFLRPVKGIEVVWKEMKKKLVQYDRNLPQ